MRRHEKRLKSPKNRVINKQRNTTEKLLRTSRSGAPLHESPLYETTAEALNSEVFLGNLTLKPFDTCSPCKRRPKGLYATDIL